MDLSNASGMPMGIGIALAENMEAMYAFSKLNEEERNNFVEKSYNIHSLDEMQMYVDTLLNE